MPASTGGCPEAVAGTGRAPPPPTSGTCKTESRKCLDRRPETQQHRCADLPRRRAGVPGDRRAQRRAGRQAARLIELIHRAIPYPVVLVAIHGGDRQPVAGTQTVVPGRDGQGRNRGSAAHGPVRTRCTHGGRSHVPHQPALRQASPSATCSRSIRAGSTAWPRWRRPRSPARSLRRIPRTVVRRCATVWNTHARLQRDTDRPACQGAEGKADQPPGGTEPRNQTAGSRTGQGHQERITEESAQ